MSDGINGSLSDRAEARREAAEREQAHAKGLHAPGCHHACGWCECGLAERLSAENADLLDRLEDARNVANVCEERLARAERERDAARADLERSLAEAAAMREALQEYTNRDLEWEEQYECGFSDVEKSPMFIKARAALSGQAGDNLLAEVQRLRASCPDDLRQDGWAVAVHNDYRINGDPHTFWLLTKGNRCAKGEGRTDADALEQIRSALVGKE